jgi:hypothetical protein
MVCDNRALLLHFEALNPNGGCGAAAVATQELKKAGAHAGSQAAQRSIGTEKQYVFV